MNLAPLVSASVTLRGQNVFPQCYSPVAFDPSKFKKMHKGTASFFNVTSEDQEFGT
jgi:hypothetical protein